RPPALSRVRRVPAGAYTLGLLAHALEAEKVHEAGHEIAATLREPAVEGGPVELGWGHGAEDTRIRGGGRVTSMPREKPADKSWDVWIEQLIQEARDAGEFDRLEGT